MRLIFEAKHPITTLEVMDWFGTQGIAVYDVRRIRPNADDQDGIYRYQLETSKETGERALRELQGQRIEGHPVILERG